MEPEDKPYDAESPFYPGTGYLGPPSPPTPNPHVGPLKASDVQMFIPREFG